MSDGGDKMAKSENPVDIAASNAYKENEEGRHEIEQLLKKQNTVQYLQELCEKSAAHNRINLETLSQRTEDGRLPAFLVKDHLRQNEVILQADRANRRPVHIYDSTPREEYQHKDDAQDYFNSPRARIPAKAVEGRNSHRHPVTRLQYCKICKEAEMQDLEQLFPDFNRCISNLELSIVFLPSDDGEMWVDPSKSKLAIRKNEKETMAMGARIVDYPHSVKPGDLVILITGRRGILKEYCSGNLCYSMMGTDKTTTCVFCWEVLAHIDSIRRPGMALDRLGNEVGPGDPISFHQYGEKVGTCIDVLGNIIFCVPKRNPSLSAMRALDPTLVYKTVNTPSCMAYKLRVGFGNSDLPPFDPSVRFEDQQKRFSSDLVSIDLRGVEDNNAMVLMEGKIAYVTRVSHESMWYIYPYEATEFVLNTKHTQHPLVVWVDPLLRKAVAKNGKTLGNGNLVVIVDEGLPSPIPGHIDFAALGFSIVRPQVQYRFRPYVCVFGSSVMLLSDYFSSTPVDKPLDIQKINFEIEVMNEMVTKALKVESDQKMMGTRVFDVPKLKDCSDCSEENGMKNPNTENQAKSEEGSMDLSFFDKNMLEITRAKPEFMSMEDARAVYRKLVEAKPKTHMEGVVRAVDILNEMNIGPSEMTLCKTMIQIMLGTKKNDEPLTRQKLDFLVKNMPRPIDPAPPM